MSTIPMIINDRGLTAFIDGQPITVHGDDPRFERAKELLRAGDEERFTDLIRPDKKLNAYLDGCEVRVTDGVLTRNGQPVNEKLANRALRMMEQGVDSAPLLQFISRLYKNPSFRAIDELLTFLDYGSMPITPDGCFLAYKRVRRDYYDVHSGTVLNKPAELMTYDERASLPMTAGRKGDEVRVDIVNGVTTVTMPRHNVDDNSGNTCSKGLHFASFEYVRDFAGERMVVLKIDPAHVVSIPTDYNNTKGRCAAYQVVGEIENELREHVWDEPVVDFGADEDEDEVVDAEEYDMEDKVEVLGYAGYEFRYRPDRVDTLPWRWTIPMEGVGSDQFFGTIEEAVEDAWKHLDA